MLQVFAEEELDTLDEMVDAAADAVGMVLAEGLSRAMDSFNSKQIR